MIRSLKKSQTEIELELRKSSKRLSLTNRLHQVQERLSGLRGKAEEIYSQLKMLNLKKKKKPKKSSTIE